ncbi:MAG: cell wall hydrolase [Clostridia bacterium]|nr:cell wall hydrolase [Clostridia bacterium]
MRRLFNNCPNKRRQRCGDCIMLNHCIAKKVKRKTRRFPRNMNINRIFILFLIIVCVIILFGMIVRINSRVAIIDIEVETQIVKKQKGILSPEFASEEYYYFVSDYDRKLIEKLVYREARGEMLKGKVAVAAVVLNRYSSNDEIFDRTSIENVIKQEGQFADISNVSQKMLNECPSCKEAVDLALRGWDPTREKFPEGAKYFYEPNLVSGQERIIREGIIVLKIGNHCFHNDFNINN